MTISPARQWRFTVVLQLSVVLIVTTVLSCASAIRSTLGRPVTDRELSELWVPGNPVSRELYYGMGGQKFVPDPGARYELLAEDRAGFSRGYDVEDEKGQKWDVKIGPESRTEIVASRIFWAVGYHQPPMHHVTSWRLHRKNEFTVEGRDVGEPGRYRRVALRRGVAGPGCPLFLDEDE